MYNESCICEEREEFERSSISYVQANCSFYETKLSRSFHKSNFAWGKSWVESLLSARFFVNTMLYIVAKCLKNVRIWVLEWVLKFENYTLIWEKHEFMVWKYLAEIAWKIMNKYFRKLDNIACFK